MSLSLALGIETRINKQKFTKKLSNPVNFLRFKKSEMDRFSIHGKHIFSLLCKVLHDQHTDKIYMAKLSKKKSNRIDWKNETFACMYGDKIVVNKNNTEKILNNIIYFLQNINPEMLWHSKIWKDFNKEQKILMCHRSPHLPNNYTFFSMLKYGIINENLRLIENHTQVLREYEIEMNMTLDFVVLPSEISTFQIIRRHQNSEIRSQKKKLNNLSNLNDGLNCMMTKLWRVMLSRNILPFMMAFHSRLGNVENCVSKNLDLEIMKMITDFYVSSFTEREIDIIINYNVN